MGRKIIIAENLRSLHNVGAIFRSADGAGFTDVWLTGYTGTPPDRRIEKVSLGAEEIINWEKFETSQEAVNKAKKLGAGVFVLELTDMAKNILEMEKPAGDFAIIIGNEVTGVEKETIALADAAVMIPMRGKKESLNVSVACAVAMYALG